MPTALRALLLLLLVGLCPVAQALDLPPPTALGGQAGFLAPTGLSGPLGFHFRATLAAESDPLDVLGWAFYGHVAASCSLWRRGEAGAAYSFLIADRHPVAALHGPVQLWLRAGPVYPLSKGRSGFRLSGFLEYAVARPPFDFGHTLYPSTLTAGPIFGWDGRWVEADLSLAYQLGEEADPAAPRYHGAQASLALFLRLWGGLQLGGEAVVRSGCQALPDCPLGAQGALVVRLIDRYGVGTGAAAVRGWGAQAGWKAMGRFALSVGPGYERPFAPDTLLPAIDAAYARWRARRAAAAAERARRAQALPRLPGPTSPAVCQMGPPEVRSWQRACFAGWQRQADPLALAERYDPRRPVHRVHDPYDPPIHPTAPPTGPVLAESPLPPPRLGPIGQAPPRPPTRIPYPVRVGPGGPAPASPLAGMPELPPIVRVPVPRGVSGEPGEPPPHPSFVRPVLPTTQYTIRPAPRPGAAPEVVPLPPGESETQCLRGAEVPGANQASAEHLMPPAPKPRGGAGPVRKGEEGRDEYAREATGQGDEIAGREVTLRTPRGDRRVDLIRRNPKTGEMRAVEVKTGPHARYHRVQREKDAEIEAGRAVGVGPNAERAGVAGPVQLKTEVVRRP